MTTWPTITNISEVRAAIALYDRMRAQEPDADPEQVRALAAHISKEVLRMIGHAPKIVTRRDLQQLAAWVYGAL